MPQYLRSPRGEFDRVRRERRHSRGRGSFDEALRLVYEAVSMAERSDAPAFIAGAALDLAEVQLAEERQERKVDRGLLSFSCRQLTGDFLDLAHGDPGPEESHRRTVYGRIVGDKTRKPLLKRLWPRRRRADEEPETPEAAERRQRDYDRWRSRNAWNHGDPPGVSGLH
jgi:hypothetical protein